MSSSFSDDQLQPEDTEGETLDERLEQEGLDPVARIDHSAASAGGRDR